MRRCKTDLNIDTGALILIALMLLALPLQWIVAVVIAAVIHELFHYFALRLLGVHINRVKIGLFGAIMDVEAMPPHKEFLCALAGPLGGILLLLLSRWIPRIAVCAAAQSFYNLLPLYPLDGGRAIRSVVRMLSPHREGKVCNAIQIWCMICISLIAIYGCFWLGLGVLPLLFAAMLWVKTKLYLANHRVWDYNSSKLFKR